MAWVMSMPSFLRLGLNSNTGIRRCSHQAIEKIRKSAQTNKKRIVLSEGADLRVIRAAAEATHLRVANITLLGNRADILESAAELGVGLDSVTIVDPTSNDLLDEMATLFADIRAHKGCSYAEAKAIAQDPCYFANLMVRAGHADGAVGGAVYTSSAVAKAAIQCLGVAPGLSTVSSFFLMAFPTATGLGKGGAMLYADCGLVIQPSAAELADITLATAATATALLGVPRPRVALLSFSTHGSAQHPNVERVAECLRLVRERDPSLIVDGDLQYDAAVVPDVAARKAPQSSVGGQADVLIFPDLQSGNIGYKMSQRLGGASAVGPIFQGLAWPSNDLSRGCSVSDIIDAVAVTAVQAEQRRAAASQLA